MTTPPARMQNAVPEAPIRPNSRLASRASKSAPAKLQNSMTGKLTIRSPRKYTKMPKEPVLVESKGLVAKHTIASRAAVVTIRRSIAMFRNTDPNTMETDIMMKALPIYM